MLLLVYSRNPADLRLSQLAWPAAFALALSLALIGFCRWAVRDRGKAATVTSLLLLGFWTHGALVAELAKRLGATSQEASERSATIVATLLLVVAVIVVARSSWAPRATGIANVFALGLLAFPLATIAARGAERSGRIPRADQGQSGGALLDATRVELRARDPRGFPDIYYLVLDAYGREDVLRRDFGLDLAPFVAALRARGFYVADRAYANYPYTELSLASAVNFAYLPDFMAPVPPGRTDRHLVVRELDRGRLFRILREAGYEIVTIPCGRQTTELMTPDRKVSPNRLFSELTIAIYHATALPELLGLFGWDGRAIPYNAHRERVEFALRRPDAALSPSRPTFVFAHVLAPHPPFLYAAGGAKPTPREPFDLADGPHLRVDKGLGLADYVAGYRDQVLWMNEQLLTTIDRLLASKTRRPAAILIQGDHGPRSDSDWNRPESVDLEEFLGIFSAYYFPSRDYHALYAEISPVNSFPALLKTELGADIPMRPDRSFFSPFDDYYQVQDVTARLAGARRTAVPAAARSTP